MLLTPFTELGGAILWWTCILLAVTVIISTLALVASLLRAYDSDDLLQSRIEQELDRWIDWALDDIADPFEHEEMWR